MLKEGVIRLKLTIHYDGTRFHGWQLQPDVRTVQGEIEAAAERLTGERRPVVGSGRTDAGVHATGQIASIDVPDTWSAEDFHKAMNAFLPADVWLEDVRRVHLEFHPRYHATRRTYEYRLGLAEKTRSPFVRPWCWPLKGTLPDPDLLVRAAAALPGEHCFRSFAKSGQPERGYRCLVHEADWSRWEDLGLRFRISADRYLHHMVRYLVGTMVDIARDRRPMSDMAGLLDASPDSDLETSPPAPPEGLFLIEVEYPPARERLDGHDARTSTPQKTRP